MTTLALGRSRDVHSIDPELGRIWTPAEMLRAVSLPGKAVRRAYGPGEMGVFIAKQHRRIDGRLRLIWESITHNERVDQGAVQQDIQCFGSASATRVFTAVAVANAALTKTKTDLSLGSATTAVTTNEFTTLGLARAAGSLGSYTAPASLGAQFTRRVTKTFTASGSATGKGAGLFDNGATVSPSNLYVEDNFSSDAVLVNGDTLTVNIDISN